MRYLHSRLLLASISVAALLSGVVALIVFTVMSASAPTAVPMTTVNIGANVGSAGKATIASFVPTLSREDAIEKALKWIAGKDSKTRDLLDTLPVSATVANYSGRGYGPRQIVEEVKVWVVAVHDYPAKPVAGPHIGPIDGVVKTGPDGETVLLPAPTLSPGETYPERVVRHHVPATITVVIADELIPADESGVSYAVGEYIWGATTWWYPKAEFAHLKWDPVAP